ncbi:MAG: TlpA disulfide reductase family protein [Deltaproteobacteria bacterium]
MNILNTGSKLVVLLIILTILILLGFALFGNREAIKVSPLVGKKAPEFTLKLFDGEKLTLSELEGKTVLLNFWASWCMPCKQEALALEKSWQKYKDDNVVFIGVNVWDDTSNARSYMKKYGGEYPHGIDPAEEIQVDYGIGGVPETFFIDASGNIIDKYNGPLTTEIIDYFIPRAMNPEEQTS